MGAGVMFICGSRTLILKRAKYKGDRFSDCWNFPGGQGEPNESSYETAIRETLEETGIDESKYRIVNHVSSKIYTLYIAIVKYEIEPILDHEHTEWRWVDINLIPSLKNQFHIKDWRAFSRHFKDRLPNLKMKP